MQILLWWWEMLNKVFMDLEGQLKTTLKNYMTNMEIKLNKWIYLPTTDPLMKLLIFQKNTFTTKRLNIPVKVMLMVQEIFQEIFIIW